MGKNKVLTREEAATPCCQRGAVQVAKSSNTVLPETIDMGPVIEKTQQTLGSLITKPKLGEKYLKKPPFRFLFDAVLETIKATGFGAGLYDDWGVDIKSMEQTRGGKELTMMERKDAKVYFLEKIICCVNSALGEKPKEMDEETWTRSREVSPKKIVAGSEPWKTNAFLVKLYFAANEKLDASPDAREKCLELLKK